MASINNVKLKNLKKHGNRITARLDMDNAPIGKISYSLQEGGLQVISVNTHYYSDAFLSFDMNTFENRLNGDVSKAIEKDEKNEKELNKRIDKYLKSIVTEDIMTQFADSNSFFVKLYELFENERLEYKNNGKLTRINKYNIVV